MTYINPDIREAAIAAAAAPLTAETLQGAEVVTKARPGKPVVSARVEEELSAELLDEAERCGQVPSHLVADLLAEALAARKAKSQLVTIDLVDLHRAIDQVARRQAA